MKDKERHRLNHLIRETRELKLDFDRITAQLGNSRGGNAATKNTEMAFDDNE